MEAGDEDAAKALEENAKAAAAPMEIDFEDLDVMGVTDILDLGNGMPLFDKFQYEDWTLLSTRYELHLLIHSFKKDLDDPDRPSFGEPWRHNWWETMSQIQLCIPRCSFSCLSSTLISFVCVMCHFYLNSSNFNPLRRSTWLTTTPSTSRRPVVCSTPMKVQVFKFPPFFLPLDCLCETRKHLWFQEVFFNKTWGISPTFHPQRHGTFNSSALRSSRIYWMWSETPWAWTKNF